MAQIKYVKSNKNVTTESNALNKSNIETIAVIPNKLNIKVRNKITGKISNTTSNNKRTIKKHINIEATILRLTKAKDNDSKYLSEIRDFMTWKKRQGISEDTKVFNITGWYPVLKECLEKKGWHYNPDRNSTYFDLKWALKTEHLKHLKLQDYQYVNHFMQNAAITTKIGLLKNIKNLRSFEDVDYNTFFPRAYDLTDNSEMQAFIDDFRYVLCEKILKSLEKDCIKIVSDPSHKFCINKGLLNVIINICTKKLDILPDSELDDNWIRNKEPLVNEIEWEILQNVSIHETSNILNTEVIPSKFLKTINYQTTFDTTEPTISAKEKSKRLKDKIKNDKRNVDNLIEQYNKIKHEIQIVANITAYEANRILMILKELKTNPQHALNGRDSDNVWIVKPAGMSRGRGIRVFNDLKKLLKYVDVDIHKESQWIVQKYIENSLLLCKRKFDIRQWVLVTSWNPLTIWYYTDCYLRFCAEEYTLENLENQFVHLANNSIAKYSEKFNEEYSTENIPVNGNMWHSDEFIKYLNEKYGNSELFYKKIQPKMMNIVIWSMKCVQEHVRHRDNTCELYGYDFMIDETYEPWLIEVNSSPACDYSTNVTEQYIKNGFPGIVEIITTYKDCKTNRNNESHIDKWKIIYKSEQIKKPLAHFVAGLQIKGTKIFKKPCESGHSLIDGELYKYREIYGSACA